MRMRSFDFSGVRELQVGDEEKHQVEIRFRSLPFTVVEVHIDGQRRIRSLFPRLSLFFWTLALVVSIPLGLTLAWFLYFRGA